MSQLMKYSLIEGLVRISVPWSYQRQVLSPNRMISCGKNTRVAEDYSERDRPLSAAQMSYVLHKGCYSQLTNVVLLHFLTYQDKLSLMILTRCLRIIPKHFARYPIPLPHNLGIVEELPPLEC